MPYIVKEQREKIDALLKPILDYTDEKTATGILNYIITKIIHGASKRQYSRYNELIGVLNCVRDEYYRRKVAPYEDEKCKDNGDIE